jgi:hypothetical protein
MGREDIERAAFYREASLKGSHEDTKMLRSMVRQARRLRVFV